MIKAISTRILALSTVILIAAATAARSAEVPTVRLAHAPHDHHAALYVAALKPDYFKANGGLYLKEKVVKKEYELIDGEKPLALITIDSSTGGGEIIRKLAEDQFDIAFGGFPAMALAIDEGRPIHVIAPLMSGGSGLVLSQSLKASTWGEFLALLKKPEGKQIRIGHQAAGSVQSLALERALKKEGVKVGASIEDREARVILVDLHGPKNFLPSLKAKVVDGIIAMQPYVASTQYEKAGVLAAVIEDFEDEKGKGLYPCCAVAARDGFLAEHEEIAVKLLTLAMKANGYLAENPKEAAQVVAAWLNEKVEVEVASLPTIRFIKDFDAEWKRGTIQWIKEMSASGKLKGKVKKAAEGGDPSAALYNGEILKKALAGR